MEFWAISPAQHKNHLRLQQSGNGGRRIRNPGHPQLHRELETSLLCEVAYKLVLITTQENVLSKIQNHVGVVWRGWVPVLKMIPLWNEALHEDSTRLPRTYDWILDPRYFKWNVLKMMHWKQMLQMMNWLIRTWLTRRVFATGTDRPATCCPGRSYNWEVSWQRESKILHSVFDLLHLFA